MPPGSGRFLRDNVFLVAAVSLPLVVVAFFLVASIVPRWLVPPPTHDLLVRVEGGVYDPTSRRVAVDFHVRDGMLEATVRPVNADVYLQAAPLFRVDHATMTVREIPIDLPASMADNDPPRTFVVEALAGQRVLAEPTAPDGYQLEEGTQGGRGLIGAVFGMNRSDRRMRLVNRGRVVPFTLPPRYQYLSLQVVGWVVPGNGQR